MIARLAQSFVIRPEASCRHPLFPIRVPRAEVTINCPNGSTLFRLGIILPSFAHKDSFEHGSTYLNYLHLIDFYATPF